MAQDDDVQSALGVVAIEAFAAAAEAFQCVRGVREVLFRSSQTDFLAEFGRHEGVRVDCLRDEVIRQPEDDEVRRGFPWGFHPAGHMNCLGREIPTVAFVGGARQGQIDPVGRADAFEARGFRLHGGDGILERIGDFFGERCRFLRFHQASFAEADESGEELLRLRFTQRSECIEGLLEDWLQVFDVFPLAELTGLLLRVSQFRFFHLVDEGHRFVEILRHAQLAKRIHQLVHLVHVRPRHELGQDVRLQ